MPADELTAAVVEVWCAVLGVEQVGPADDLAARVPDREVLIDAVSLTNQWLGGDLTVPESLELRTAARMAAVLRRRGVRAPGVPARAPVPSVHPGEDHVRRLWNATYRFATPGRDTDFDTAGWFAPEAPVPMGDAAMREWLDTTVARLSLLAPSRVLDLGCGTGMVLSRLAPMCESYVGVDFADAAVIRLRNWLCARPTLAHVDVVVADAEYGPAAAGGRYDLVLLNSVIQYFPNRDYLVRTIEAARSVLALSGAVFLGDVRNAALAPSAGPTAELTLTAADLAELVPDASVRVLVRRGRFPTPMNRLRFDALLSFDPIPARRPANELTWPAGTHGAAFDALTGLVADLDTTLVVRSVPDTRTSDGRPDELDATVHPDRIWRWGDARGIGVAVAPGATAGRVDIAFWRGRDEWATASLLR